MFADKKQSYVWATSVEDEVSAGNALVLWASLKKSGTKYPIMTYVGKNVSSVARSNLEGCFDWTEDLLCAKVALEEDEAAKVECWNSKAATRVVFLSSGVLVTGNNDKIFEVDIASGYFGAIEEREDFSILLVNVNNDSYNELIEGLNQPNFISKISEVYKGKLEMKYWSSAVKLQKDAKTIRNELIQDFNLARSGLHRSKENLKLDTVIAITGMYYGTTGSGTIGKEELPEIVYKVLEDGAVDPSRSQNCKLFAALSLPPAEPKLLVSPVGCTGFEIAGDVSYPSFSAAVSAAVDNLLASNCDLAIAGEFHNGSLCIMMKRLSTAENDRDRIYAVITKERNKCEDSTTTSSGMSSAHFAETVLHLSQGAQGDFEVPGTCLYLRKSSPAQGSDSAEKKTQEAYILTLSAKSESALDLLMSQYADLLESQVNVADVCYTAAVGRQHFEEYRAVVIGKEGADLVNQLRSRLVEKRRKPKRKTNVCYLFSGLGAHVPKMGYGLYQSCSEFRQHFDTVAYIAENKYGLPLRAVLWETQAGKYAEICSLLGIFATEYALNRTLDSWGIVPQTLLPHSCGEMAAAVASAALSLPTALFLLIEQQLLFDQFSYPGRMLAIKGSEQLANQLIQEYNMQDTDGGNWIQVSAANSEEQTTVSGPVKAIQGFKELCNSRNIKTFILPANVAYHSKALDVSVAKGLEYFGSHNVTSSQMRKGLQYASSVTGNLLEKSPDLEYFVKMSSLPVKFVAACNVAYEKTDSPLFLEIGPLPLLCTLVKKNIKSPVSCVPCMEPKSKKDDFAVLLEAVRELYLSGVNLNWENFYRNLPVEKCSLPCYPFQTSAAGLVQTDATVNPPSFVRNEGRQAWVTFAFDEESSKMAAKLLHSIRATHSSRKAVILLSGSVSHEMCEKLMSIFDEIIWCPNSQVYQELQPLWTIPFLHCLSLTHWDKLALLDPSCTMLDNCDALWELNRSLYIGEKCAILLRPDAAAYFSILKNPASLKNVPVVDTGTNFQAILHILIHNNIKWEPLPGNYDSVQTKNTCLPKLMPANSQLCDTNILTMLENRIETLETSYGEHEPIAIVGLSCRMPGANSVEEYWKILLDGTCVVRPLPSNKWAPSPVRTQAHDKTEAGWLNCQAEEFDGKFFGISPKELCYTDPQQRLLLEVAWEAFEEAGINPESVRGTNAAVFAGAWTTEFKALMHTCGFYKRDSFYRTYMGNSLGNIAARLAHFFGFTGPNIVTESGCSSSGVAIGLAVQALRRKDTNLALACGVNLLNQPYVMEDIKVVLSKTQRCHTFDSAADGFVRAEGVGVLVLKRLSDAVKDGDKIHSLIRGFGMVQEGCSNSMGTPTVDGEANAMLLALKDAGVQPQDVHLIEAHGTGTAVGDPMELLAITKIYSSADRKEPLIITSGKANTGHCESAAAMAGLIKTTLQLQHKTVPPQVGLCNLNPQINLTNIPAIIPTQQVHLEPQIKPLLAGISSFGITGTNTHMIIQEAPKIHKISELHLKHQEMNVVTLSAKTQEALDEMRQKYKNFLAANKNLELDDVAYTTNVGRCHFSHRLAVTGRNCLEVGHNLERPCQAENKTIQQISFLFTGQGSQWHKMGQELYNTYPVFRESFESCENTLDSLYGLQLRNALWGGDETKLHASLYSQASIFVVEYCLVQLWASWGIRPSFVVGHSLGEFAAATTAGILSMEDALKLLGARCQLIDALPQGKMIAIKGDEQAAKGLVKSFVEGKREQDIWLDVAAVNSPEQTTLSGPCEVVQDFLAFCKNNSIKATVLNATHAFHSRAMGPMLQEYAKVATSIQHQAAQIPFISGVDGVQLQSLDADYWIRHTRNEVKFSTAANAILAMAEDPVFLEIGPHPVISALIHANNNTSKPAQCYPSMRKGNETATLLDTVCKLHVQGATLDWEEFHRYHLKSKITLPFYPFQRRKYWFPMQGNNSSRELVHPLLGSKVDLPQTRSSQPSTAYFQNFISLKTHHYIGDHRVGKFALVPAAVFAELAMAAGLTKYTLPLSLKDVKIMSPLLVEDDSSSTELCTVLDPNDRTIVFSKGNGKWKKHSEASLSTEKCKMPTWKFAELQITSTKWSAVDATTLYKKLASLGYNFGDMFQSLYNIRRKDNEMFCQVKLPLLETTDNRDICHPIILDSMIQSLLLSNNKDLNALHLPVQLEKFLLLEKISFKNENYRLFIYVCAGVAYLWSSEGQLLAMVSGLEVVKTNLKVLEKLLSTKSQDKALPPLYQEKWVSVPNSRQSLYKALPKLDNIFLEKDKTDEEWISHNSQLNIYIGNGILLTLLRMGLDKLNTTSEGIILSAILESLRIIPEMLLPTQRLFEVLSEDGYFTQSETDFGCFSRTKKVFPSQESIVQKMLSIENLTLDSSNQLETRMAARFISSLEACLKGTESAQAILFSNTQPNLSADKIYTDFFALIRMNLELAAVTKYLVSQKWNEPNGVLHILEIGAGTGSATKQVLPILQESGIKFTYIFTDLSSYFFIKAKENFAENENSLCYEILNIDKDPLTQGLRPGYFDLVIASNCLHATIDLSQTLRNIRLLMKSHGILLNVETLKPYRICDISFNLLPGYWHFQDFDLRPKHCLIDGQQWQQLLKKEGFGCTKAFEVCNGDFGVILGETLPISVPYTSPEKKKTWLLFGDGGNLRGEIADRIRFCGRHVVTIDYTAKQFQQIQATNEFELRGDSKAQVQMLLTSIPQGKIEGVIFLTPRDIPLLATVDTCYNITASFLTIMQEILATQTTFRLRVITHGQTYHEDSCPMSPASSVMSGFYKSLQTEYPLLNGGIIDLIINEDSKDYTNANARIILQDLWVKEPDRMLSIYNGNPYRARLFPTSVTELMTCPSLDLPGDRFHALLPDTKALSDLKYEIAPELPPLNGNQVEIEVKSIGLNFRDILRVLQPTNDFTKSKLGLDYSGVVVAVGPDVTMRKVGDHVVGANTYGNLPSHLITTENNTALLPSKVTFSEGAALPVAFFTVHYCLNQIAMLQAGETLLVHTASGAVGLMAIQIAKAVGAKIVATAGKNSKREYLKSLGVEHVYSSRHLDFELGVIQATGGRGVDVVLNTLTGPGFKEATLRCCATNARFVEISKLNIWSEEEVRKERDDVSYTTVDLLESCTKDATFFAQLGKSLEAFTAKNGVFQPLPVIQFAAKDVRSALVYFQKAKHIGKVVLNMPSNGKLLNSNSTYLITGGCGGIGFEVCKWMCEHGAKYIALMGRRTPEGNIQAQIDDLNDSGNHIKIFLGDVGDQKTCQLVLEKISKEMPRLKGVMHSAGCLSDALFVSQTMDTFHSCFNAKVKGGWYLHQLTQDLQLDHFVVFSSASAVLGSAGQTNHSSANSFLDSLVNHRLAKGLPALTINWGQWGEVGIAAGLTVSFLNPFTTTEGLNALGVALRSHTSHLCPIDFNLKAMKSLSLWAAPYMEMVTSAVSYTVEKTVQTSSEDFWAAINAVEGSSGKFEIVLNYVSSCLISILNAEEKIGKEQNLQDVGMDSLMRIEFKNLIQSALGTSITLNVGDLEDCHTLLATTKKIMELIEKEHIKN